MDENIPTFDESRFGPRETIGQKIKRWLVPVGALFASLSKLKGALWFLLKFKTALSMLFMIAVYAQLGGWRFAVGFVLLIFVHECGHLLAAKRLGLNVGAPVFIPFMGAVIALKEAPKNAWIEAQVGIGGPLLGSFGALVCMGLFYATQYPLFLGLAYTGFLLNLFNLIPIGFLDGGRIVTALSPWFWLVGVLVVGFLAFTHPNFILFFILILSIPRLFFLFRRKSPEEMRYFEVTASQRFIMGALYFGLIIALVLLMRHLEPPVVDADAV